MAPHLDEWERAGELPRELHREAGELACSAWPSPRRPAAGAATSSTRWPTEEIFQAGASGGRWRPVHLRHRAAAHRDARRRRADRAVRPADAGRGEDRLARRSPSPTAAPTSPASARRPSATATATSSTAPRRSSPRRPRRLRHHRRPHRRPGRRRHLAAGRRAGHARASPSTATLAKMGWHCSDTAELASWTCACRRRTSSARRAPASPRSPTSSSPSGSRWPCRATPPRARARR